MTFPCAGGLVGILFRDIVLLKRSDKDVKGCTAKHCPRDWPEEGRPVFIASQFRLQEEGAEMTFSTNTASIVVQGKVVRPHLDGRLYYLEGGVPSTSPQDVELRKDRMVPIYHTDTWHGRTHASAPVMRLTEGAVTGMRIDKKSALSMCGHCQAANMLS